MTKRPASAVAWLLAMAGVTAFVLRDTTPWGWPSLDLASAYLTLERPGAVTNDFFTACLQGRHGRIFQFWLTAWPIRLGAGWYETLYGFMLANSGALPAALFLGLSRALDSRPPAAHPVLALGVLVAIMVPAAVHASTVAWWPPYTTHFHPSGFAMTCLFSGAYLALPGLRGRAPAALLGLLLVLLAALLHPSYTLGGLLFLAAVRTGRGRKGIAALVPIAAVGLLTLVGFKAVATSGQLPKADYLRYFTHLHPEHYVPSRFVGAGGGSAWPAIAAVCVGGAAALVLARWTGRRGLAYMAAALLCLFAGSLLAQYWLVERHPISKAVVLVSPARFAAYGYWSLWVLAAACAAEYAGPLLDRLVDRKRWRAAVARCRKLVPTLLAVATAAGLCAAALGARNLGPPERNLSTRDRKVLRWLRQHTSDSAEVAAPPTMLRVAVPLLTGRGTYAGNGFPFEDGCLAENHRRYVNLFGDPTGPRGRGGARRHYDNLDLAGFSALQPPVDVVVMNAAAPGAHRSRAQRAPDAELGGYLIYRLHPHSAQRHAITPPGQTRRRCPRARPCRRAS